MNIEELAFKNYYELINIQKIDLLLIIEFLQKDRKQWINQFTQTHNESVEIQKENEQLKERMEYLERSNDRREEIIIEQRQEINNLEDNWDELKEIIRKKQDYYKYFKDNRYRKFLSELLNKMQELERGVSDVED